MKKKVRTYIPNMVKCDNASCTVLFELTSPEDVLEMRTIDEFGMEVAPRQFGFVCPRCMKKYSVETDEEDWKE